MTVFVALYIWYSEKSLGVRKESFLNSEIGFR